MKITITVTRSAAWLQEQRIATGEQIPDRVEVEVDPRDLDLEARQILIEANRRWCSCRCLWWSRDHQLNLSGDALGGEAQFWVDSDEPAVEDISQAIVAAHEAFLKSRTKWFEGKIAALVATRELLVDELADLRVQVAKLKDA